MYHGSGNYEAFARPRRPKGVDDKSAYLVGVGLASLAVAATHQAMRSGDALPDFSRITASTGETRRRLRRRILQLLANPHATQITLSLACPPNEY